MDTITTILYILGGLLLLLLVVSTFAYLLYLYVNSSSVTPGKLTFPVQPVCNFYPLPGCPSWAASQGCTCTEDHGGSPMICCPQS